MRGALSKQDAVSIKEDFFKSLILISNGDLQSRFTDSVNHKGCTYYEFRCSLSANREYRIYYYLHKGKIVYFNSIIKKTGSIPGYVKDRTVALIKEYKDYHK